MANQVMNFARGKIGYYAADALGLAAANSRLVIVVLEAAEADDTLNNYDDLAALLGAAGNTEATSVNYSRIELAAADITASIDDTANTAKAVVDADQTWSSVSQSGVEDWVKLLVCYDADNAAGTDSNIIVLTHHDFAVTPNGGDITADFDQTNGFWASS
jgi:hypothetical protein